VNTLDWIILAVCILLAWPARGQADWFAASIENKFAELARNKWLALAALGFFAIIVRVSTLAWMPVPQPQMHDELSYLLAADTFSQGRLTNPAHSLSIFFDTFHVIQHPTYASMYPPAQGAVLAFGNLLGHPWIGVLLSTAAMCVAISWMLQSWVSAPWALLGGTLVLFRVGIFSYWINSYWGGSVAAMGAALVIGAWPRLLKNLRKRDAGILGCGVGILAISRPLEGFIFCIPVALSILWWYARLSPRPKTSAIKGPAIVLASTLICILGFIAYNNWRVTGSPRVFPYSIEQRSYLTSPVFVWQGNKPQLTYSNAQFDDFYNRWLPTMYRPGRPGFQKITKDKFREFWRFFLGPALSIPLLLIPWVIRSRNERALLAQFTLSWIGLIAVAWFHPHYAAPLMTTTMILVILGLRKLRNWQFRGRPVGVRIVWLIVLFSILIGPVHFLISRSPSLSELCSFAPEGMPPRYIFGLAITILAIFLLRLRSGHSPQLSGRAPIGKSAFAEFLLLILAITQVCIAERTLHPGHFVFNDPWVWSARVAIQQRFKSIPGQHLLLVKYAPDHNVHDELVYNAADIDGAKLVWAREIPGQDLDPLLSYYQNRKVWVVEPDEKPFRLYPYSPGRP
jgi:hypothetical protein